jgi:hypothetical protein
MPAGVVQHAQVDDKSRDIAVPALLGSRPLVLLPAQIYIDVRHNSARLEDDSVAVGAHLR